MQSTAFVRVSEVKAALGVRSGVAQFDDRLKSLVRTATAQIETAVSRRFTRQQFNEYFRTSRTDRLFYDLYSPTNEDGVRRDPRRQRYNLTGFPVVENDPLLPATVWYDPNRAWTDDRIVQPASYILDATRGTLDVQIASIEHPAALRVRYTAGYVVDTVTDPDEPVLTGLPEELKVACVTQTIFLFNKLGPSNVGVTTDRGQGSAGEASFSRQGGIAPEAAALIAAYKPFLAGLA